MIKELKSLGLITLSLILFGSCSSDDDNSSSNTDTNIEGTWFISKVEIESIRDFNGDGESSNNIFNEIDNCSRGDGFIFNADGTGQIVSDSELVELDADFIDPSVSGDLEYIINCVSGSELTFDMNWTQQNNVITVVSAIETNILLLNNNELSVFIENSYQVPVIFDTGGYDLVLEDATFTYTKQ